MQALQLRDALAAHLGQPLTPEVAAAILRAAVATPDRSIDLRQFEPLHAHGFVIQAERFADVLDELKPLHEAHWLETERHRHGIALAPDYQAMAEMERTGRMLQFTMRCEGVLAGHLRMYVLTSLHTGTRFAEEDTLYVKPEHRGSFAVMRLMRYAEAALLSTGAREIRANSKLINRADVLMKRMGYQPVATQFVKVFGATAVLTIHRAAE